MYISSQIKKHTQLIPHKQSTISNILHKCVLEKKYHYWENAPLPVFKCEKELEQCLYYIWVCFSEPVRIVKILSPFTHPQSGI